MANPVSPDKVQALRLELDQISLFAASGKSVNELCNLIAEIHNREGYIFKAPIWEPDETVFRARRLSVKPIKIRELSYPPAEFAPFGRLNAEGSPVFYGTHGSLGPSVFECSAASGDHFAIGKWVTQRKLVFNHLGFSKNLCTTRPGRIYPPLFIRQDGNVIHEVLRAWQSEVFTRPAEPGDDSVYRLSNALAAFALPLPRATSWGQSECAGIIYPSVATNTFGDNVAILPKFIDDGSVKFIAACYACVEYAINPSSIASHDQEILKLHITDSGRHSFGGTINWTPLPPNSRVF